MCISSLGDGKPDASDQRAATGALATSPVGRRHMEPGTVQRIEEASQRTGRSGHAVDGRDPTWPRRTCGGVEPKAKPLGRSGRVP